MTMVFCSSPPPVSLSLSFLSLSLSLHTLSIPLSHYSPSLSFFPPFASQKIDGAVKMTSAVGREGGRDRGRRGALPSRPPLHRLCEPRFPFKALGIQSKKAPSIGARSGAPSTGCLEVNLFFDTPLSLAWVDRSSSYFTCWTSKGLGLIWCIEL